MSKRQNDEDISGQTEIFIVLSDQLPRTPSTDVMHCACIVVKFKCCAQRSGRIFR